MWERVPPCCADAAKRAVKMLNIGGNMIGITQLNNIVMEVLALNIEDDDRIGEELLKRARIYNYFSPRIEADYADALWEEYRRVKQK